MKAPRGVNVFPAATKLRHAVSAERKSLMDQPKPRHSLQSIIGATDTVRDSVAGA
jgi:hypothetical protein